MILQSLHQLYGRLDKDPEYENIPPPEYRTQNIAFVVVLHPDGRLEEIQDVTTREEKDGKPLPLQLCVPGQTGRTSGVRPYFLTDKASYLFGYPEDEEDKTRKRALKTFEEYRKRHLQVKGEIDDPAFSAVCCFLQSWQPEQRADHPELEEFRNHFGVFKLIGELCYVHDRPNIKAWWLERPNFERWWDKQPADDQPEVMCLVTGEQSVPARIHEPKIKGFKDAQSGAALASFNRKAFCSYGKEQSLNSPVSRRAAFRYCTALNSVLSGPRKKRHRLEVGDTTVVFWTDKRTRAEGWLADLLDGSNDKEAQDATALQQTKALLQASIQGAGELTLLGDDPETRVHLLGLAPNKARLAVRFWHTDSLGSLFEKLKAHYDALHLVRPFEKDREFPSVWDLLLVCARERKDIPPMLVGALMRAILEGSPYPDALAHAVIRRIRADREINYYRAAMLKAWLTRKPTRQGEIPVSLDTERTDLAYRLGRLFAVLEKTQKDALPGINATIRDSFYSAASATPVKAFPRLLRTYQHHLAGLKEEGAKINREKRVGEIFEGIDRVPAHLNLEDQALFSIGYYHERKALFTKAEGKNVNQEE